MLSGKSSKAARLHRNARNAPDVIAIQGNASIFSKEPFLASYASPDHLVTRSLCRPNSTLSCSIRPVCVLLCLGTNVRRSHSDVILLLIGGFPTRSHVEKFRETWCPERLNAPFPLASATIWHRTTYCFLQLLDMSPMVYGTCSAMSAV